MGTPATIRTIGSIPVRNIWLLFLYASNLAQFFGRHSVQVESSPDFEDLVARLLCFAVELRLRRNLSRGYRRIEAVLPRVRGRIDLLQTHARGLLERGAVACRLDEFTFDIARNRLARAALGRLAKSLDDRELAGRCRRLEGDLLRLGVAGPTPSRHEIAADRVGRHDHDDLLMISLSRIVFDLVLPTEDEGGTVVTDVEKKAILVRRLFEKAVGNFCRSELSPLGWRVRQAKRLDWQFDDASDRIHSIFPAMEVDIELERASERLIVDTKFTSVFARSQYREEVLKSAHIYQLYAYLRSQERSDDPLSLTSAGMLLYPTVGVELDQTATIQGHTIRFVTVDLTVPALQIVERLRSILVGRGRE
ncbi:5-methylcytosine-specific restriction endonuclease system specificity protein McrC (plasmid) [Rhizobium sp. WSM4643]|uniref:5-methylcytosine-specific restriction endonuclease system specificity protein McrC n=1 Tax=Rhizobium sp. WSM4643 TaxID=3138253 RepID=UPI0021A873E8|nr:5-methylcytosine-specific restriction endonuclease system specificity protein McrC [Rhizobium leguminosarum]UWM78899.1 5-methylcytosine-specific restriction endonuclease system specificity protein McrC [Rhizobium leguminosarum bv. viciae]